MPKIIHSGSLPIIPENISPAISFRDFVAIYQEDMAARLKPSSIEGKRHIITEKILPFFGDLPMCKITTQHVRRWQSILLKQNYSMSYLQRIDLQLSAIMNYAERYYDFPNPCRKAGHIGRRQAKEVNFWTLDEYERFICHFSNDPEAFTAFELLYWTGMRQGELLALTTEDIDLCRGVVHITKTCTYMNGQDIISTPKTKKSIRDVGMPPFLAEEVDYYIRHEKKAAGSRLFCRNYHYLRRRMSWGCRQSGVRLIRTHDLRHSHVSLLINHGFSALDIADRVGHESVTTTLDIYSHLFPDQQQVLVDKLEQLNQYHPQTKSSKKIGVK